MSLLGSTGLSKKVMIENWLKQYNITNYHINSDLTIDVHNSVNLWAINLTEFPSYIQFNKVDGWFDCSFNKLTSLRGCPKVVVDDFVCSINCLKTLEGGPEIVQGSFCCNNNELTSLEGCPKIVNKQFYCNNNTGSFSEKDILKICKVDGCIIV